MLHPAAELTKIPFYRHLYFQVVVAIIAGMLIGHFYPEFGASLKPLGDAFIRPVKMIIAPVIFLTVATGIAGMSDLKKLLAASPARRCDLLPRLLDAGAHRRPRRRQPVAAGRRHEHRSGHADAKAVSTYATKAHETTITGFLMNIIPETIVGAFAQGDILQVLFFSVLFGVALGGGRREGQAGHGFLDRAHGTDLPPGCYPDEGCPDRCLRRHGLHHRRTHRLGRQPRFL